MGSTAIPVIFLCITIISNSDALNLVNARLKIATNVKPPFMYYNNQSVGNDRFSGFLKDILDQLIVALGTNTTYDLYLCPDKSYGAIVNGSWNGLVREVLVGNADLVLADLTVNEQRQSAIDFTYTFLDTGLTLLVPKPPEEINLWSFLSPFTPELWGSLLGLAIVMSVIIYGTDRISPYGYYRNRDDDRFNFSESLFMSLLVFVGQSSTPSRSWGARTIILFYFAFNLIVLSYYTANLTASLTVQMAKVDIHGIEDLQKPGTLFSVIRSTSSQAYFQTPNMVLYKNHMVLYDTMDTALSDMKAGIIQAVVGDAPTLEFISNQQPCDTFVVGDIFFKSNFAIGLNYANSSANFLLSKAILHLRESGYIDNLYQGWWLVGSCSAQGDISLEANQISFINLAGVFMMIVIGIGIAVIVLTFELIFSRWHKSSVNRNSFFKHVDRFLGGKNEERA